jgi:hypothetical protein
MKTCCRNAGFHGVVEYVFCSGSFVPIPLVRTLAPPWAEVVIQGGFLFFFDYYHALPLQNLRII